MGTQTKDLGKKYKVDERFENILSEIQEILIKMGIIDQVEINTDLLGKAIVDYFEDIDRLKEFEDIPRVNVNKIYSYGIYWILRRHPIQILDKKLDERFWYINEKVCIALAIPKMMAEMGIDLSAENKKLREFLELVYYNFKYRVFTQQSLELMMEAFFCGYSVKVGGTPDGTAA